MITFDLDRAPFLGKNIWDVFLLDINTQPVKTVISLTENFMKWLEENKIEYVLSMKIEIPDDATRGSSSILYLETYYPTGLIISFYREEDAILFKLTWV
jgi:hypothetical protein